jgi:glycosyltransferase 2 family protein
LENHNTKKTVKLLIQIFLTVLAIYLLLSKVSVVDIVIAIQSSNFYYLLLAFIAFNISKIISAVRLNQFFLDIGLKLSQSYNLSLYYLGMFYNLFLPGGIGGDGYKVYLLNKNYHKKVLTLTKALLLDRISGLIALLLFTTFLLLISSFAEISYLIPAGSLLFLLTIYPLTFLIYKSRFKEFLDSFKSTNFKALLVQLFQLICALFIIMSLDSQAGVIDLLVIFFISSIVAILPFTIGGIGARELTFLYLLEYIHGDVNAGVTLSVLFFIITAASSFIGIIFIKKL